MKFENFQNITRGHKSRNARASSYDFIFIAGFHSRDQQPCFSTKTKGSVCIIIELNSRRIWSGTNMAVVTSCEIRELYTQQNHFIGLFP